MVIKFNRASYVKLKIYAISATMVSLLSFCYYFNIMEGGQIKGKTIIKYLMESGHHESPEQLQCSLPSLFGYSKLGLILNEAFFRLGHVGRADVIWVLEAKCIRNMHLKWGFYHSLLYTDPLANSLQGCGVERHAQK